MRPWWAATSCTHGSGSRLPARRGGLAREQLTSGHGPQGGLRRRRLLRARHVLTGSSMRISSFAG
jgi:hypothetical protein